MHSGEDDASLTAPAWDDLLSMPERDKIADTSYNAAAGRLLVRGRRRLGFKQADMAAEIAATLGVPVSQSALSGWENGTRSVPGAVLAVILERCASPIDGLVNGEESEVSGEVVKLSGEISRIGASVATALETLANPSSETPAQRAARLLVMAREIRSLLEGG